MNEDLFQPVEGVDFKVTDKCMLRCTFCANEDGPEKRRDIDVRKAIAALHELRDAPKELGSLKRVFFTGGEPLMRLSLVEQVARARLSNL